MYCNFIVVKVLWNLAISVLKISMTIGHEGNLGFILFTHGLSPGVPLLPS